MDAKDMKEFKEKADQLGQAAAGLKSVNEQTGKTVGEMQASVKAVNEKINGIEAEMKQMREADAKKSRPGFAGADSEGEEYKSSFVDAFMRKGDSSAIEVKAGSLGVDADGGFLVPTDLDSQITQLLGKETPMREVCRVITVGNQGYKKNVNIGGSAAGWVGETDARPETQNPKIAQIAPTFAEIYANPGATQAMLNDSVFNVADWYAQETVLEFAEAENAAFTVGDGIGKPKGILAHTLSTDADDARTFGQLQQVNSGVADNITSDNLIKMIYALRKKYRNGASFMAAPTTIELLRTLKDGNGNYLWRPGLELGQPSTLSGYAVHENEDMPVVAAGATPLMFGNFMRGYTIVDVQGVRTIRDELTNKPFVHFYTTKRVGGMLEDSNAIKVLKCSL